jgi:catechol 2,3-dioxygenase-like lactoylglutathione lyase family enzyme
VTNRMKRIALGILIFVALPCWTVAQVGRPQISGIAFVRVSVQDLQAAISFYGGTLRLPSLKCDRGNAKCFFVSPLQRIEVSVSENPWKPNRIETIGIFTSDAGELRKYLVLQGQKPGELSTDSHGISSFQIQDPEHHALEFVQSHGVLSSVAGPPPIAGHIIHAGFVVNNRAAMDTFYKDILGFRLYWHGGMTDDKTQWVDMQVPDGTDWIEYMLNIPADADKHTLGVMNHIALGVPDVKAAAKALEANGVKLTEQPKIGRDGKWQLNLYDPDQTRVEFMEFTPVEKPCCAEYTGPHPKP